MIDKYSQIVFKNLNLKVTVPKQEIVLIQLLFFLHGLLRGNMTNLA